ncbi:hypothetical protein N7507_009643 [Penicillium longicatenatum]|nr:hypothetical protein N7507_009643 [Penicillium longicatenatum]
MHIFVLSKANYEFAVAAFAILAIGGVVVSLPTTLAQEQMLQIMRNSRIRCISPSYEFLEQAIQIKTCANSMGAAPVDVLKIDFTAGSTDQKADSGAYIDLERESPNDWPGIVFFSLGVSGAPKGVVHSRRYLQLCPEVPPDDVVLVNRPANWAGWSMILLTAIIQGRRAEIIDPSASPGIVWDRLRDSKVTILSSTVFLWEVLARHFQNVLRFLPSEERNSYLEAVQSLRSAAVGGSMPVPSLLHAGQLVMVGDHMRILTIVCFCFCFSDLEAK